MTVERRREPANRPGENLGLGYGEIAANNQTIIGNRQPKHTMHIAKVMVFHSTNHISDARGSMSAVSAERMARRSSIYRSTTTCFGRLLSLPKSGNHLSKRAAW